MDPELREIQVGPLNLYCLYCLFHRDSHLFQAVLVALILLVVRVFQIHLYFQAKAKIFYLLDDAYLLDLVNLDCLLVQLLLDRLLFQGYQENLAVRVFPQCQVVLVVQKCHLNLLYLEVLVALPYPSHHVDRLVR